MEIHRTPRMLFQDCVSSSAQRVPTALIPLPWWHLMASCDILQTWFNVPGIGQIVPECVCVRLQGTVNSISAPYINPPFSGVKGIVSHSECIKDCPDVPHAANTLGAVDRMGNRWTWAGVWRGEGVGGCSQPGTTIVSWHKRDPLTLQPPYAFGHHWGWVGHCTHPLLPPVALFSPYSSL